MNEQTSEISSQKNKSFSIDLNLEMDIDDQLDLYPYITGDAYDLISVASYFEGIILQKR